MLVSAQEYVNKNMIALMAVPTEYYLESDMSLENCNIDAG